ncbi:hypothetical protein [Streptomyces subrutilus]|uniref:hypothetical protein n=1 Tax=Streptomyces subrutilus TaxID=36818 RepID=UPI0034101DBE
MQSFKLRTGHTVTTQRIAGTGRIEFVTANREGDVISSVQHPFAEAVPLLHKLRCGAL